MKNIESDDTKMAWNSYGMSISLRISEPGHKVHCYLVPLSMTGVLTTNAKNWLSADDLFYLQITSFVILGFRT